MRLFSMRSAKRLLLPAFLLSLFCAAQKLPDTPAGHQFSAWLEAFNLGDREGYRSFLEKNYPSGVELLDGSMVFRQQTGGFDLKKVEESTPTKLVVVLQERLSDQFARLNLEVEAAEPHHIANVSVEAIQRPTGFEVPHMSESDLLVALRKQLEQEAAADRFAGAALVAINGKPIFTEAYGLADREHKVPNTIKTRFRIGSMNKMFTAVATLQLVQAGKLGLNDPLGKYLPDYPNKDVASKVTIHYLLTHTGGTGDFFGPEYEAHRLELRTLQDYVKLFGSRGLQKSHGGHSYSRDRRRTISLRASAPPCSSRR